MIAHESRYHATQIWRQVAQMRRERGDQQGAERADRNADVLASIMMGPAERRGNL